MAGWFTQPRLDLGGASTLDAIRQALDCLARITIAHLGDDDVVAMRGHAIKGARYALDRLILDPPFGVVAHAAGLDPTGLQHAFDAGRFDDVCADLRRIIGVGRAVDLPEGESLVRATIDEQAAFIADLDEEFQNIL
jgi:predicted RNA methylase